MPRPINPKEHAAHRAQILAAATALVNRVGYEAMTVQDILDATGISKGAFYHYFSSKHALLEALIDSLLEQVDAFLTPIIEDPELNALQKLCRAFQTIAHWKSERMDLMLGILRIWYADSNAIVRQKATDRSMGVLAPALSQIIAQGIREGVLHPAHPEQVSLVVCDLLQGMGNAAARMLLFEHSEAVEVETLIDLTAAYTAALERVLDAPNGSIVVITPEALRAYVDLIPRGAAIQPNGHSSIDPNRSS